MYIIKPNLVTFLSKVLMIPSSSASKHGFNERKLQMLRFLVRIRLESYIGQLLIRALLPDHTAVKSLGWLGLC